MLFNFNGMMVYELIELLNKIEDKTKEIGIYGRSMGGSYDDIITVSEDADGCYIEQA